MTQQLPVSGPPETMHGRFRSTEPVPTVVTVAFWILIVGGAVTMGIALVNAAGVGIGSSPAVGTNVGVGIVGVLIRIGVAVLLRRGYGPARIYLTVVSVASLAIWVLGLIRAFDPLATILMASVIVAVVLVWLPSANRYFRVVGQARRQAKAAGMTIGFLG
jgi:hypothetical protein